MALIFGVDPSLFVFFALIASVFGILIVRFLSRNAGAITVVVTWVFKNHTALRFKAREDLRGIFLDVMGARGKVIEALKKEGLPIEVEEVDGMKAYILKKDKNSKQVNILVKHGRSKFTREFVTVEGTGKTLNFVDQADRAGSDTGNAPVIQEERSAAKEFLAMLASSAQGAWGKLILPILTGLGMGVGLTMIIMVLFGHLK
jgi:hypothetical protein